MVEHTRNVSFEKKRCQSLYETFRIFSIAQKLFSRKGFERNGSSVSSMLAFFARVCFYEVAKILRCFVFALVWNLVFMYKGSQPRIYADLHSFQSSTHNNTHEDYNFIFHSFFSCSYTCL